MVRARTLLRVAGLVGGCVAAWGSPALAQAVQPTPVPASVASAAPVAASPPAQEPMPGLPVYITSNIPLKELPAETRERIKNVVEKPTLTTRGPQETFNCQPEMYHWLLSNPDQAVKLWRMLGAKAADIQRDGDNQFSWKDANGSRLTWHTIYQSDKQRIWYAEGNVKPSLLLPMAKVQALAILNYTEGKDGAGKPAMRHQLEVVLHTDSSAIGLAAKLLGPSAPKMAEQYAGQVQTFYAAMAWYLDQNPQEAKTMLERLKQQK